MMRAGTPVRSKLRFEGCEDVTFVTFETDYSVYQLTLLAGNTAGHALTGGHKQALRHASETPLSSERVQYRAAQTLCAGALRAHTQTHTHMRHGGRPYVT